jgi:hypothetical protein
MSRRSVDRRRACQNRQKNRWGTPNKQTPRTGGNQCGASGTLAGLSQAGVGCFRRDGPALAERPTA